jgi:chitinase
LFPQPGPDSDKQKFDVEIDSTMGGEKPSGNSADPNDNAFGFYIMSGMKDLYLK